MAGRCSGLGLFWEYNDATMYVPHAMREVNLGFALTKSNTHRYEALHQRPRC